jgi:signal transduction histidine kinase
VPRLDERIRDEEQGARAAIRRALLETAWLLGVVVVTAVALVGVAGWLSTLHARHLARSLRVLCDGAHRVAAGDLGHCVSIRSEDELGVVAQAFNEMARGLHENTVTRHELSREVAERTSDLERSRAELERNLEQLRAAQAQLVGADRMAAVGLLAAGVAHEINNPLAFILTNVGLAVDVFAGTARTEEEKEAVEALRDARAGAERVRDIVRALKGLARTDAPPAPVEVQPAVEATLALASHAIKHQARLVRDYQPVPEVALSDGQLGQIVLNLVMNALQAMPAREVSRNEVRVATRTSAEGWALIEVADNGVGITPEVQARLFQPFFTTKPAGLGTGLGLSICKHIVDVARGRISVQSTPGQGTVFRVELPRAGACDSAAAGDCASWPANTPAPVRWGSPVHGRAQVVRDEPLGSPARSGHGAVVSDRQGPPPEPDGGH